jgi:hypothetical protein
MIIIGIVLVYFGKLKRDNYIKEVWFEYKY